jgi:hypothetical protein
MTNILRLLIALAGLAFIAIGLLFLVHPAEMAKQFFLEPIGSQGLATLRADFPGFFITGGAFALLGALRRDAGLLRVPMVLLAIALFGRSVSLVFDGVAPTAFPPMVVEAVMLALIVAGAKSFERR